MENLWIVYDIPSESILLSKRNDFTMFECTEDLKEIIQHPGKYLGKSRDDDFLMRLTSDTS